MYNSTVKYKFIIFSKIFSKMTTQNLGAWNQKEQLSSKWLDALSDTERNEKMTQEWAENLRGSTVDSVITKAWTKSDLVVQETWLKYEKDIHTLVWFLSATDELLRAIQDTKDWISKKWLSKAWKETMKNAKEKLNQYEKQLKGKRNALLRQERVEIYDNDIANLKNLRQQVNIVRADIWVWQWGELSGNASFLYNSPENAQLANRKQTDMLKFGQNLQEELKQWAILNIFNWNVQGATEFYRRIAEWKYTQADYELLMRNTSVLTPSLQRCWVYTPILTPGQLPGMQIEQSNTATDYSNMDRWETFQKWWIAWCLDKVLSNFSNMSPSQRNTWKSLGVLWGVAAWIFWLYKFYTNKEMWFWGKAWITAATIFGAQALTWEWPISLFNKLLTWWFSQDYLESKFWSAFWSAVNSVWNSPAESANTIAPAMYSMMVFNPKTTIWDINTMTQQFKSDPRLRTAFRSEAIDKLKNKYWVQSSEYFSATFSDNFDEKKRNNRLASFGVTDVSSVSQRNVSIYEVANNATMNEIIIEKFKTEHGVKETSNEVKKKEFEEYIKNLKETNQAINVSDLEKHQNDWFELDKDATYTERPVDIQFKDTLTNQVESLWINEPKKTELKAAIKKFYDERTIDSKPLISDFSLQIENGLLVLTSHNWQKTKINIDMNEIVDFWRPWSIRFSDLSELLNVADITNSILNSQKWKIATGNPPFQYKSYNPISRNWIGVGWRWIYFNDETFSRSINFDTRVLSWGWWWKMWEIETLSKHPNEYAEYLSKRWMEVNQTVPNRPTSN